MADDQFKKETQYSKSLGASLTIEASALFEYVMRRSKWHCLPFGPMLMFYPGMEPHTAEELEELLDNNATKFDDGDKIGQAMHEFLSGIGILKPVISIKDGELRFVHRPMKEEVLIADYNAMQTVDRWVDYVNTLPNISK